jgi:hypothetical protein
MVVFEPTVANATAVRALIDTRTLRVAVYFDHTELHPVATSRVAFASSATSATPERGAVALPGLRVKVEREQGKRVEVTATYEFPSPDSGVIAVKGWLNREKIGFVYRPSPAPERGGGGKPFFIDTVTDVRAIPGGSAVARVGAGAKGVFFPVTVLSQNRGHAQILVATPELEVRGSVPSAALEGLEPETHRGWGRGHFDAGLWQKWPKEQVGIAGGTCIYDAPGGEPIGVFKRAHVENVVIVKGSDYREYRLPHRAVGYLHVADLIAKPDPSQFEIRQRFAVTAETWTCPQR